MFYYLIFHANFHFFVILTSFSSHFAHEGHLKGFPAPFLHAPKAISPNNVCLLKPEQERLSITFELCFHR